MTGSESETSLLDSYQQLAQNIIYHEFSPQTDEFAVQLFHQKLGVSKHTIQNAGELNSALWILKDFDQGQRPPNNIIKKPLRNSLVVLAALREGATAEENKNLDFIEGLLRVLAGKLGIELIDPASTNAMARKTMDGITSKPSR